MLVCSNVKIVPVEDLMDDESQKIVIFDDFLCKKTKNH